MRSSTKYSSKTNFYGAGLDATSWFVPVGTSRIPHKPYGATWPFARLSVSEEYVEFSIAAFSINKTGTPSDVIISLGKSGYVYFRKANETDGFSFATFRLDAVIRALRKSGFTLDESFDRNMLMARVSLSAQALCVVLVAIGAAVLLITKPSG